MVYPRLMSAEPCSEHSQWQAVMSLRLFVWGASMGGDTDTIAALADALSTAFVGSHNIPGDILETIKHVNHLDLAGLAGRGWEKM